MLLLQTCGLSLCMLSLMSLVNSRGPVLAIVSAAGRGFQVLHQKIWWCSSIISAGYGGLKYHISILGTKNSLVDEADATEEVERLKNLGYMFEMNINIISSLIFSDFRHRACEKEYFWMVNVINLYVNSVFLNCHKILRGFITLKGN